MSITPLHPHGLTPANRALDPFVEKLFGRADVDRDGRVSKPEFTEFLDQVLQAAAGDPAIAAPAGSAAHGAESLSQRLLDLARKIEPNAANLRGLAARLGPSAGSLDADGLTFTLRDGSGALGIRDRGIGAAWQWMPSASQYRQPGL